jgi:hypothetical protein
MSREQAGLFEPEQAGPPPPPTEPPPAGPRPPPWLLLALALTLAVGAVLGFALGTAQADRQPATAAPTSAPAPTTRPAPPPSTKVVVRNYASPACLETAQRADRLIELLIRNQRTRIERLLVAYTVAARQCRQDSTPTP